MSMISIQLTRDEAKAALRELELAADSARFESRTICTSRLQLKYEALQAIVQKFQAAIYRAPTMRLQLIKDLLPALAMSQDDMELMVRAYNENAHGGPHISIASVLHIDIDFALRSLERAVFGDLTKTEADQAVSIINRINAARSLREEQFERATEATDEQQTTEPN